MLLFNNILLFPIAVGHVSCLTVTGHRLQFANSVENLAFAIPGIGLNTNDLKTESYLHRRSSDNELVLSPKRMKIHIKNERIFDETEPLYVQAIYQPESKILSIESCLMSESKTNSTDPNTIAFLTYHDKIEKTGWGELHADIPYSIAQAYPEFSMYAVGFLEGYSSAKRIQQFRHNANAALDSSDGEHHSLENIKNMFDSKVKDIMSFRTGSKSNTEFWRQARYALFQTIGIRDGCNARAKFHKSKDDNEIFSNTMSLVDMILLSSDGETPELQVAYDKNEVLLRGDYQLESSNLDSSDNIGAKPDVSDEPADNTSSFLQLDTSSTNLNQKHNFFQSHIQLDSNPSPFTNDVLWRSIQRKTGRCSALIRLTNDDIFVGHTTFSDYSEMLRIFKYYNFPLPGATSKKIGFSSYPGIAGSTDDYYLMDNGIIVTETTISMVSDRPYDRILDNKASVPDFMRIMIANRLASSGEGWVDIMRDSATGTYSSQWMIVDTNRFRPDGKSKSGLFMVFEQAPNTQHAEDMTSRLKQFGYWGSYNRAWFTDVRNKIGVTKGEEQRGVLFSKDSSPRAHIFQQTASKINTVDDMKNEMQRNRWPNEIDGGSMNTPDHAIAARSDIDPYIKFPNGAVDSKVANLEMIRKLKCEAICGPTTDNGRLKPFSWVDNDGQDLYPDTPHEGLPDKYEFEWVLMRP